LFGAAFAAAHLLGHDIPNPSPSAGSALALFALFLPTALLEEIGWSGYALAGLQQRMSSIAAALILGASWALWHIPALLQVDRSAEWIAYWCLWTISARIVMVWLYNWSGASVFAVALYHAISNVCWQLYPVSGSHFDPRLSGLITLGAALALTVTQREALCAPTKR
jgi:membrane protease YdiL (CAAX protease family)